MGIQKNRRRKINIFFVIIGMLFVITGCAKKNEGIEQPKETMIQESIQESTLDNTLDDKVQENSNEITYPLTVIDQIGREVVIEKPAERIVSSYYITTAISIALGMEDKLVGIEMKADTRELYKKAAPQIIELPAVGSGKGVNIEEIANIKPDIVILPKKLKDSVEQLEILSIPVLVVDPETLSNYNECVELLGNVFGCQEKATELLNYYETKTKEVEELLKDVTERPSVYLSSGASYLRTCTSNMYQNDLIQMAGGDNVSKELTDGYWAEISKEQLLEWNPEYILPVSYAEYSVEDIINDSDLAQVKAIAENKVILFPSKIEPWDYPTPSSVLGILWLTHTLHSDIYTKEAYIKEAQTFYQQFFGIEVTEEELGL